MAVTVGTVKATAARATVGPAMAEVTGEFEVDAMTIAHAETKRETPEYRLLL
jgi:hypothetical protein